MNSRTLSLWVDIPSDLVRASCEGFERRAHLVIRANGEIIEYIFASYKNLYRLFI